MIKLTELRIPRSGSVENAKMVRWLVAEGDAFASGQALYEIETDKTTTEVEAEKAGILARCQAREGDEMKVGDLVGFAAPAGASLEEVAAALDRLKPAASATGVTPADEGGRQAEAQAAPRVRRLAAELGVDLSKVAGSGPGGRITAEDVAGHAKPANAVGVPAGYETVPVKRVANSMRRRAIARRLLESVRNTATLTADMQIDLSNMMRARAAVGGKAPSVLAYIACAACRVLAARPEFNATYTDDETLLWQPINLGIAVDSPEGLVVPVIMNAGAHSVAQLDAAIRDLAERARAGQTAQSELDAGTFTISNPGSLGPVIRSEGILNPPQIAALGLPAVMQTPVAVPAAGGGYSVEVRPVIRVSLNFDHRALDGGQVIGFLNDLKHLLEAPG